MDIPGFMLTLVSMIPIRALTAAFCLATSQASADIASSAAVAAIEAGIVCAPDPIGAVPAPGTVAGSTHIIEEDPAFVTNSRRVPAVLGVGFGVKSRAKAPDGINDVTIVLSHPEMGEQNATVQSFSTRISGTGSSFTFYQFDYAYELVPGPWQFTAMSGDEALYSVNFEVVAPERVPELADICGYLDLLS